MRAFFSSTRIFYQLWTVSFEGGVPWVFRSFLCVIGFSRGGRLRLRLTFLLQSFLLFGFLSVYSLGVWAYNPQASKQMTADQKPSQLEGVGVQERLGEFVDLNLNFHSDTGEVVGLGELFSGSTPILMTMVYYNCPSLCNYHLNGLNDVFRDMEWSVGQDFKFIAVSMDHREGPAVAAKKKANYIRDLERSGVEGGWHFLTGSEANVSQLASQLGFSFRWDAQRKEYAHPAVAYVITPKGQISKYLHGINFDAKTLRLALVESSKGKVGTWVDQVLLFCYRFDPAKNKYTLAAYNIMRIGGLLTVIILAIILIPLWFKGDSRFKTTS